MIRWCLILQSILGLITVILLSSATSQLRQFIKMASELTGLGNVEPVQIPGTLAFLLIACINSTIYTIVICFDPRVKHAAWSPSNFLITVATLYAITLFIAALLPALPSGQGASALSCSWTDYGSWREIFSPSVYEWSAVVDGACKQLSAAVAFAWILEVGYIVLIALYLRQRSTAAASMINGQVALNKLHQEY